MPDPVEESMSRHPAGKKTPLKSIEELLERIEVKPTQYIRKPFFVDAVQVTADNMADAAKWCDGKVMELYQGPDSREPAPTLYIKVRVKRPLAERQTRAFVGDWILSSGNGFKVYTQSSFDKNFEAVAEKTEGMRKVNDQMELLLGKLEEKYNA